jgi:hypothetical protein
LAGSRGESLSITLGCGSTQNRNPTGANNSFNPTAGVGLVTSNQLGPASG